MPGMMAIDKVKIQGGLNIEMSVKVEKKYREPGDDEFTPYIRAIEDAVRDVVLDENDALEVARRIRENAELRKMTPQERKARRIDKRTKFARENKKGGR